ncbi:hypothetical protein WT63_28980 [Burkholderia anthina]|nr:hypothetical protein WT63_28980 [Burkholderia anthina]
MAAARAPAPPPARPSRDIAHAPLIGKSSRSSSSRPNQRASSASSPAAGVPRSHLHSTATMMKCWHTAPCAS